MFAQISLIKRRPEVPVAQFRKHWLAPHGVYAAQKPHTRWYVQSHVVDSPHMNALARKLDLGGFPEFWFDSVSDLKTPWPAEVQRQFEADEDNWLGVVAAVSRLITEVTVVRPMPEGRPKVFMVNTGPAAGGAAWAEAQQARVAALPGVCGYVSHRIIEQAAAWGTRTPDLGLPLAGIAEAALDNEAALAKVAGDLAGGPEVAVYVVEDHRFI
jgi:hypothetical protein